MDLIKITNNTDQDINLYLDDDLYSSDNGVIEVIIGWSEAKERGASIRNHKIDDNTYWTFLPTEKRRLFLDHIEEYKTVAFNKIKQGKSINNIDPLDFKTKEELVDLLTTDFSGCTGYLFNDRLYIYNGNEINHLDMSLLNFMSWDIESEIKDIVKMNVLKKETYMKYLEYLDVKYIPYLIDAEENTFSGDVC